ncbi:unnamed protein product, partial [Ectocarpus sp. 12 AP-2014]
GGGGSGGSSNSSHHQPSSSSDMQSPPPSSSSAFAEIGLKRFGLHILRAVIETAPPVGDGSEGLPGMWQAGGGADGGGGVSTNEGKRGRKVDEDAIRDNQEKAGRRQQQE